MLDLNVLITKIVYARRRKGSPRGYAQRSSAADCTACFETCGDNEIKRIYSELDLLEDVRDKIDGSINDDPPFSVRDGGIIKDGFNPDVDYLRSVMRDGKSWVEKIGEEEKEKTGIRTLKIGFNRVFGYYIEVSKSFATQVPERFIRKQTLANGERYITQELKDLEATILGAEDKLNSLEYDLFQQVRAFVADNSERILKVASLIASIDCYWLHLRR